ncbi:uricase [Sparassis latifolia]
MSTAESYLAHACYGKDKVRVLRVVREGAWHTVVEYYVQALLEGDIDASYTEADNRVVVATDSIKNITYYLAKTSPHVLHPERFALHLGTHLVCKYAHIRKAHVAVERLRWTRIPVRGQAHPHAFVRDGEERRVASVEVDATAGKDKIVATVTSGLTGLLVLKSTGSAFENFVRDEYTTLVEVDDRIFSTAVDVSYVFAPVHVVPGAEAGRAGVSVEEAEEKEAGSAWDGERVAEAVRGVTLEVFAQDESASVQATLYKMAARIVAENARVQSVTYKLPNKHYVPVDMRYIGLDNTTPANAEVFLPLDTPSGLITATIARK